MRWREASLVLAVTAGALAQAPAPPASSAVYREAAVATDHAVASQAGFEMLERGGNAVDAAVAARFCLSVVRPCSCGIGGGGFMVIAAPAPGEREAFAVAVDYRETAPRAVGPDYYVNLGVEGAASAGCHSVGVPGEVAGLLWVLERYGTLDRRTVLAPAIRAAVEGYLADEYHVWAAGELAARLEARPDLRDEAAYLWDRLCLGGTVEVGDRIVDLQQARALALIADGGHDAFYAGPIAEAIVDVMRARGGPMTARDLAHYRLRAVDPLRGSFGEFEVLTMPPPSSGGVALLQMLGIIERRLDDVRGAGPADPRYVHLLAESMKHAFADRAAWLADADFVDVPVARLLDGGYLDGRAAAVRMDRTLDAREYGSLAEAAQDGGTSHLSIIDARGMAVSSTDTINLVFGSMVSVPGFGFALNDEMDDFTTIPGRPNKFGLRQSERNLPEPGKRPLSSMTPTIVLAGGRPYVIAGASGGPRIINGTLQAVLNCVHFGMGAGEAVGAGRFHHQWLPDVLEFDERWRAGGTIEAVERLGHATGRRDKVGDVQLILVGPSGIEAACDPRKGGAPAGR